MIQVLRLEFRKMRRLRVLPILLTMVAAVVALSSILLFSPSSQEGFEDPASTPWAGLLLGYTMMAAMTSPILMAVLASRQTDIEHTGGGWFLSQVAGFAPGQLLRAKFASLSLLVVGAVALQSLAIIGLGIAAGIRVPLDLSPWMTYTGLLILVNIAFLALHLARSNRREPTRRRRSRHGRRVHLGVPAARAPDIRTVSALGLLCDDLPGRHRWSRHHLRHSALSLDRGIPHPRRGTLHDCHATLRPNRKVNRCFVQNS